MQMFLNMTSANRAADLLRINRKTAQRIFADLRQRMARENDRGCVEPVAGRECDPKRDLPGESENQPLCRFGVQAGKVRVMPTVADEEVPCCSALTLVDATSGNRDWIGRLRLLELPGACEEERRLTERFWSFARRGLRRYRAGYRRDLTLYLKEMAFRFNHPEEKDALRILLES